MKGLRFYFIAIVIIASTSHTNAQIYKRFSIELGVNRSINYNMEEIISSKGSNGNPIIITNESRSYKNNFSTALGFQLFQNHFLKLRYSKNTIGTNLTGRFTTPSYILNDSHNLITNNSWGIMYAYQFSLFEGHFGLGLGVERQFNNFDDAWITTDGVYKNNYALYSAVSFDYPLFKYIFVYSKAFMIKAFRNNYIPPERKFGVPSSGQTDLGSYVPLQIGIELGLKFTFEK